MTGPEERDARVDVASMPGSVSGLLDEVAAALASEGGLTLRSAVSLEEPSTHRLLDVEAVDAAGRTRRLVLKALGPRGVLPEAVGVRPPFVVDDRREPAVYRSAAFARFRPALVALAGGSDPTWLAVERVDGEALWRIGDVEAWEAAAATLARLGSSAIDPEVPLLHIDDDMVGRWVARAGRTEGAVVANLLTRARPLARHVAMLPRRVLHGEAYPSNTVVSGGGDREGWRAVLVDWESASFGPALVDLAALTIGWDRATVKRLCQAYRGALAPTDPLRNCSLPEFVGLLDVCTLYECVRWLGWAQEWQAPEDHDRDWVLTALDALDRLGW